MLPRRYCLMLALLLPALLLVACRFSKTMLSPGTSVPVSQEAADRLEEKLGCLIQGEDDGAFGLQVTEAELTSYVVFKMAEQIDRSEELPLENFQARFAGGQMIFSGKVTAVCLLCFDVQVVASAHTKDGELDVSVDEAQMGAVRLSTGLLKNLSRIITETIIEAPERMERAVEIADIEIGEGVMQISGRVTEGGK